MEKSYLIIYKISQEELAKVLIENNLNRYIILNKQLAAIYVDESFKSSFLNQIEDILWWQTSKPMSSLISITNNIEIGETAVNASGIDFVENNPYITASGKGVIVVVIDSGIDYLHPDFINKDRTTKIISIWDQESTKGKTPEGLLFGSEFTREDINKAIEENDGTLTEDKMGTGTIAAGISSGKGNLNLAYRGIAIDSELIVVKLREYKNMYDIGKINYQTSDFLAAIRYVEMVASREDKYIIINLTLGKVSSPGNEASLIETFDFLTRPGVIMVSGAGNQGNTDIHYQGKITDINDSKDILIQIGEQQSLEIILYGQGPDKIAGQMIAPSGEISTNAIYTPDDYTYRGKFNIENTRYEIANIYPWLETAYEKFFVDLIDVKPGVWTLRLNPEFIIDGDFDIYLPSKNLIDEKTRFLGPSPEHTITDYATIDNVITVGAYNTKTDSMWIGSSKGPLRDGSIKPDIVAGGVDVISTYRGQTYNTGTGTGISSSVVCGVLAVIMEFISEQSPLAREAMFTQILKTYLMIGATKFEIYKYPNPSQGYGVLNVKETIIQIANNIEEY